VVVQVDDSSPNLDLIQAEVPFTGMTARHMLSAAGRWAGAASRHPFIAAAEVLKWASEEAKVLAGTSALGPDAKDRRFADPWWDNPLWKRLAQMYLATDQALQGSVDKFGLEPKSAARARFVLDQVTAATAPTNNLLGNPAALKRAFNTRGRSLVDGSRHFLYDVRNNGAMPSQVDTRPFRLGETIAVSRGEVIHRNPMFELIQYEPATRRVAVRPTVVIPPQINRYYFLDLAPGRSFAEYAVSRGIQVFMISWRNPTPEHRDWGLDRYAGACMEAFEVATEVAGADSVNACGFCSGGMTELATLSYLAASGRELVHAATVAVTLVDTGVAGSLDTFSTERTVKTAVARSRRKGVLDGRDLARVFAWVRPNDLVWNYWVSNYLMGITPPPFDVLAWNADSTNLPAALHADFMRIWVENSFVHPGSTEVLDVPVDLARVKQDMYVVGARTDHLVPWQSAYAATQVLGGDVRFVLSNSGHIQALVNPPDNPKAAFYINGANPSDPSAWLADAHTEKSSWWVDWADWTLARSGEERASPRKLGSTTHPRIVAAPGEYVRH
jgi:poly[(R)-3-hydroxyalkanoate] polymerase subunit PhaC